MLLLLLLSSREARQLCRQPASRAEGFGQRAVRPRAGSAGIQHRCTPLKMRRCCLVFTVWGTRSKMPVPESIQLSSQRSSHLSRGSQARSHASSPDMGEPRRLTRLCQHRRSAPTTQASAAPESLSQAGENSLLSLHPSVQTATFFILCLA